MRYTRGMGITMGRSGTAEKGCMVVCMHGPELVNSLSLHLLVPDTDPATTSDYAGLDV